MRKEAGSMAQLDEFVAECTDATLDETWSVRGMLTPKERDVLFDPLAHTLRKLLEVVGRAYDGRRIGFHIEINEDVDFSKGFLMARFVFSIQGRFNARQESKRVDRALGPYAGIIEPLYTEMDNYGVDSLWIAVHAPVDFAGGVSHDSIEQETHSNCSLPDDEETFKTVWNAWDEIAAVSSFDISLLVNAKRARDAAGPTEYSVVVRERGKKRVLMDVTATRLQLLFSDLVTAIENPGELDRDARNSIYPTGAHSSRRMMRRLNELAKLTFQVLEQDRYSALRLVRQDGSVSLAACVACKATGGSTGPSTRASKNAAVRFGDDGDPVSRQDAVTLMLDSALAASTLDGRDLLTEDLAAVRQAATPVLESVLTTVTDLYPIQDIEQLIACERDISSKDGSVTCTVISTVDDELDPETEVRYIRERVEETSGARIVNVDSLDSSDFGPQLEIMTKCTVPVTWPAYTPHASSASQAH